jgi:hypothetical protein
VLQQKGCRDYYIGSTEYPWDEVERRSGAQWQVVFTTPAEEELLSVPVATLLSECAEAVTRTLQYALQDTVGDVMGPLVCKMLTRALLTGTNDCFTQPIFQTIPTIPTN